MSRERLIAEMTAVGLVFGSILIAVALLSHSPLDPSPLHASTLRDGPVNLVGPLGAALSAVLYGLLGITALLLPPVGVVYGWRMLRGSGLEHPKVAAAGWSLTILGLPGIAALVCSDLPFQDGRISCGGLVGHAETELLGAFVGPVGRLVVLGFLVVLGVVLVSGVSVGAATEGVIRGLEGRWSRRREAVAQRRREVEERRNRRRVLERQVRRLESDESYRGSLTIKEVEGKGRFRIQRRLAGASGTQGGADETADVEPSSPKTSAREGAAAAKRKPAAKKPVVQEEFEFIEDLEVYDLPKISFLETADSAPERDSAALIELSKLITNKCQEFRVRGEVTNIRTGPVITTYEFRLDSGVKISAVQNLAEDLALALRTESVRIERVPGRATVGIEVPSPDPEIIRLRQVVESTEFQRAQSLLTLALGVDIRGKPFVSDLARMPHLLMGGFTGSGKSVGINAMIMSILYKAKPDEVKFILVDPKMVELGVYSDIPHLLTPIISDPKKAASALGWAVAEMDNRYRRLAALGVRNLEQHNQLVSDPVQLKRAQQQLAGDDDEAVDLERLPYIVIIIDELADLMMTSSRAVEESITRLAQKARAVGVHLICATQRPSVDVLTGIIKANFPCRMAYKVRSKFDSRTILDAIGAEHLIGRGDMLYLPPGTSALLRLHGPLVTEKEIATVVRYAKRFGKPEYQRQVLTHQPLGGDVKGKNNRATTVDDLEELTDPMYDTAARLVVETRKASASYIQRRLHLGYTRSARLLDMMEREGIVGPLAGSKGREVLVSKDHFAEVDATHALNDDSPNPS